MNDTLHNLFSYLLSDAERVVMSLGPKFLPLNKIDNDNLLNSDKRYEDILRILYSSVILHF